MGIDGKATILVVDDVPDNIMVLEEVLRADYDVVAATNGEKALKLIAAESPPDLVLLDVMMPGIDGFEVCRRVKSDDQTAFIPVVMVTALSGRDDRIHALEAGADDFLNKPIDPTEVKARVRSLLRVKKLHDSLQDSLNKLQRLETLRQNLTSMIIHDLRTPLTAVMGSLSLLYDYAAVEGNADAEEMHEMASQNSEKLLAMINDLLDVTKMESGAMKLDRTSVDIATLIVDVEKSMQPLAILEEVQVACDLPSALPPLSADREMLRRVLVNLVANALKFTPAGGHVVIHAKDQEDAFVKISVVDDGPGIPAGYEDKIFEKFGQVESGERKKLSTGLGLTFCKMAVEAHGGKIRVDGAPGGGSDFSFLWPVA